MSVLYFTEIYFMVLIFCLFSSGPTLSDQFTGYILECKEDETKGKTNVQTGDLCLFFTNITSKPNLKNPQSCHILSSSSESTRTPINANTIGFNFAVRSIIPHYWPNDESNDVTYSMENMWRCERTSFLALYTIFVQCSGKYCMCLLGSTTMVVSKYCMCLLGRTSLLINKY